MAAGFRIFLYVTIFMTIVIYARAGAMADADGECRGRAKILWPVASAAVWAFTLFVLGWWGFFSLIPQVVLFFAIGIWRAREHRIADERQHAEIRRREAEREEAYRRERARHERPR